MVMNHAPFAVGDNVGAGGDMMHYIRLLFISILLYLIWCCYLLLFVGT